jgi:hypothetical protein
MGLVKGCATLFAVNFSLWGHKNVSAGAKKTYINSHGTYNAISVMYLNFCKVETALIINANGM